MNTAGPVSRHPVLGRVGRQVEVVVGKRRIHLEVHGPAGARGLVLLHGGAAHGGWWDPVVPGLATRYRVAVPDLSGHGFSAHADRYTFDRWAEEAISAAEAAEIAGRPILVGHSKGGVVALRAAHRYGARLAGAVAVDSALRRWSPEEMEPYRRRAETGHRRYPSRAAAIARFVLRPEDDGVQEELRAAVAARAVVCTSEGWTWRFDPRTAAQQGPIGPEDLGPAGCPVALLHAEHGLTNPEMNAEVVRALSGSVAVHEIAGSGHHVPLARPAELVTVLGSLLEQWLPS